MLNITLILTASPELLAAISNISSTLRYQNVENIKGDGSSFTSSNIRAEHNFQQIPNVQNAPRQNFENVAVPLDYQAAKTDQYVQTVLPIDIPAASIKQGGGSGIQQQSQGHVDAFQTNAQLIPTTVQGYTMEQLAVAAIQIVDAGRKTELVDLLSSFGVQALTSLPKEQYGAFATQLRALGAKI